MRKAWVRLGWPYVAIFLAGTAAGATGATVLVGRAWQQQFASQYLVQVADQANVAREIYAGHAAQLAERIRGDLPEYVKTIEVEFSRADQRDWALCMVGSAYEASGQTPPTDIQAVLSGLACGKTQS
jgi:hypothetical protein